MFPVQKHKTDIRMLCDASSFRLNDVVWIPWFQIPTVETHLRCVEFGSYMTDIDIGEIIFNFFARG